MAKASHMHMYAWRTANNSVDKDLEGKSIPIFQKKSKRNDIKKSWPNLQQGSSDCGESGAGQRLLVLLERSNVVNVLVVVTRWYGGTALGPARFRHITSTAAECLKKAKYL